MNANQRIPILSTVSAVMVLTAMFVSAPLTFAGAQANARKGDLFAQKLVQAEQAMHPETEDIDISATTSRGCVGIASTDKSEIGEKCDKDDVEPMRTGKPYVEKEKDGFDVSLPLHDSTGKIIGTVGIGFKLGPGQTEASVTQQAQKIASEMEAQIPSKAKLFSRPE